MKTHRVNARVPPDVKEALTKRAEETDSSESRIIVLALREYLKK